MQVWNVGQKVQRTCREATSHVDVPRFLSHTSSLTPTYADLRMARGSKFYFIYFFVSFLYIQTTFLVYPNTKLTLCDYVTLQ